MKFRVLAAVPWLLAFALLAIALALGADQRSVFLSSSSEVVKVLGLTGCALAALAFERGDYMRGAWGLQGLCFVLLLVRDVTIYVPPSISSLVAVRAGLVTFANVASVWGMFRLARALEVAGLGYPGEPKRRAIVMGGAIGMAALITGAPFFLDARALVRGDLGALVAIASDLGDALSLCLLAPVVMTAIAMRGGLLRWPWELLAGGLFAWLFYDATAPLAAFVSIAPGTLAIVREVLRTLACSFIFSAALAHRFVVTWVPSKR